MSPPAAHKGVFQYPFFYCLLTPPSYKVPLDALGPAPPRARYCPHRTTKPPYTLACTSTACTVTTTTLMQRRFQSPQTLALSPKIKHINTYITRFNSVCPRQLVYFPTLFLSSSHYSRPGQCQWSYFCTELLLLVQTCITTKWQPCVVIWANKCMTLRQHMNVWCVAWHGVINEKAAHFNVTWKS